MILSIRVISHCSALLVIMVSWRHMATQSRELPTPPPPKPFYSIEEVANLLGLHRATVSGFISSGELRAARLGHRTVRITHEALMDFLHSKESEPPALPGRKNRQHGTQS